MNNAEKSLVEKLIPALSKRGFKWVKAREMFIRKELHGFSSLAWTSHPTHDNGGRLELGLVLSVRHDIVEDVVNELGLIYGDNNKKYTATVDRGLAFFPFRENADYKQYIHLRYVDIDIQVVTSNIISMLDEEGEMFFKQYSSLLECSRGLNDPIESRTHPLCNNFPKRVYYGVATAFFAEKLRVPELVRHYLEFAKKMQHHQYEQISKRLDQLIKAAEISKAKCQDPSNEKSD